MFVKGLNQDSFRRDLLKQIDLIQKLELTERSKNIFRGHFISTEPLQSYIYFKDQGFHNRLIQPIVLDACTSAEIISGGSGNLCFQILIQCLRPCMKMLVSGYNCRQAISKIEEIEEKWLTAICNQGSVLDGYTWKKILKDRKLDSGTKYILERSIEMSGPMTSIHVEKSQKSHSVIEKVSGYQFNVGVDSHFLMGKKVWHKKDVRVISIDGMIESVSEIHHMLERASENREPYVIFARECKPDVLQTIFVNMGRGTLDVIPIAVGLTEETANILNDIAAACNTDIVSSYKGDLISTAVSEELPVVSSIHVSEKNVSIFNPDSKHSARRQLHFLKSEKDMCRTGERRNIFEKRIVSLSGNRVMISVGTDLVARERTCIEQIDTSLRMYQSFIKLGYLDTKEISVKDSHAQVDNIISEIFQESEKFIPAASAYLAIRNSMSSLRSIISIGYALVEDN